MMKTLYGKKKTNQGKISAFGDDPESESSHGAFGEQNRASFRKNPPFSRSRFCPTEKIVIGIRCPACGEMFLQSDYHYTEGTGLCIPCWEKGVLSCQ
jgi:hypothetical protein